MNKNKNKIVIYIYNETRQISFDINYKIIQVNT